VLLGVSATQLKLGDLGMQGKALEVVEQTIQKPNGMIITTGPTGSGKTTTLYAFLNELNNSEIKIITLEDPVEYKLEGIQQTPIDHTVNFDFATGLRAILRQDPDIVMVGEIRDLETADTACQAALTGHLVFSTLHTNDAAGAIPRLQNMGVKPFVLGPALSLVIAQRLVRKLCPECITPAVLSPQTMERVQLMLKSIPPQAGVKLPEVLQFYHSKGCSACHNLGYKGRMGVYEVIEVNDELRDLIQKGATTGEVKKVAQNQGSITMGQDGLLKALQKITDVEEVLRVVGE
jgi:type II secretory ATPase GspE/PulE/Tfp pilus assembly ATPase PilB-like protein